MCTVSFIPTKGKVFITSNRDENIKRPLALPPSLKMHGQSQIIAPKDPLAGGTWIAIKNDTSAMVMLNGAFVKHQSQASYRKSRGQVFGDIFFTEEPLETFCSIDLQDIEPFTLVLWQNSHLYQLCWDGDKKHLSEKDKNSPHIWSSRTLYTIENVAFREQFFSEWLARQNGLTKENILGFHLYTDEDGNAEKNIRINRNGQMLTVSVSCIEMSKAETRFNYYDLLGEKKTATIKL